MKTTVAILSAMVMALGIFTGCKKNKTAETDSVAINSIVDMHTSQNSIDYEGTYAGILPCADCEGVKTEITLEKDTYAITREYIGKGSGTFRSKGSYKWDGTGSIITLEKEPEPNKYKVGENVLIQLDSDGNQIAGEFAANYRLQKK